MLKSKKVLISLGMAAVLTVGTAVTAFADLKSTWNVNSDFSGMRHGRYVAYDLNFKYYNFHLKGTYTELKSGYTRNFDQDCEGGSNACTPYYKSQGQTAWHGYAQGQNEHCYYESSTNDYTY